MKNFRFITLMLVIFYTGFFQVHAQTRIRTSFNSNWKFKLDSVGTYDNVAYDDSSWRVLQLPHDWSIEGSFDEKNPSTPGGGALPGGIGWYRKSFTLPAEDKGRQIHIVFDGVYRNSEVWINGQWLGKRPNGYISFDYDLTPYLHYGTTPNTIVVKADNSQQPNSRWYSGSGIYRNVWLLKRHQVHVDENGTFIRTPKVSASQSAVHISTTIYNESNKDQTAVVETAIVDPSGKTVERSSSPATVIKANMKRELTQQVEINNVSLWSIESPALYTSISYVKINGKVVDEYHTKFGIRSFEFDVYKGFSLNGKPMKILGVCNHHDLGCLGAAINTRALERQLEMLKAMGCNGIRTSHNPPAPELLDLCDKMGFIVMDEAFDMWAKQKTPYDYHLDFPQWRIRDLQDQIKRDRNHPSVFVWSVGNEIGEQWGDAEKGDTSGRVIARELVHTVQELDTSRPIVTANNEVNTYNNLIQSGAFDMIGVNYNHNWWPDFHKRYPGKKLIVTESVSALETRGAYDLVPMDTIRRWPSAWDKPLLDGNKDFSVSAYDHVSAPWGSTHEETWRVLKNNDHVSGMYIWTGWDYIGEPTPYPWPARSSYFGIIDLAGFPKDVYYMYQSEWTNTPVLHVLPHWNWKNGDKVDVVVYYNNADEVELFLNGKSLGKKKKTNDTFHVKWTVPFAAGTIKAVSTKNGATVLTKEVNTAGAAAKIMLTADRSSIKADGRDLSFVTVQIVDAQGNPVPNAEDDVQFAIEGVGLIAGVDNGSPTSMESFKGNARKAFHGKCLAVIQSTGKTGTIKLKATAAGLSSADIEIQAK
jgi:beta-galactosidase